MDPERARAQALCNSYSFSSVQIDFEIPAIPGGPPFWPAADSQRHLQSVTKEKKRQIYQKVLNNKY